MKGRLTILVILAVLSSSCINIPPPSPMGDGAVQQIGLINVFPGHAPIPAPPPKPRTVVNVTDKGVAINFPKK